MAQPFDPYRALGVRRDATEAEVKAAHRRLAKRFHPDADGGDRDRFLRVQEAYKVLSDALLRSEWDAKHAPGPIRGGASPTPASSRARAPRRPQRPQKPADPSSTDAAGPSSMEEPASRRPRSSRAYTWSAAEVPWWEEGVSGNKRQPGKRRPSGGKAASKPAAGADDPPTDAPNSFDVYNRSSGAAWSSAARAYFRRGDQDLPRRGSWQYEGTQVLTGARARTYADAQAKRRAAAPRPEPAPPPMSSSAGAAAAAASGSAAHGSTFTYTSASAGVAHDAHRIHEVRRAWQRRTNAASWPSLKERLLYALVAWIPAALVIGYGGAAATGCDGISAQCPPMVETVQAVTMALVLGLLVALPKVAYVGSMAAIGGLLIGLVVVGVFSITGVNLPLSIEMAGVMGVTLSIAYLGSAAFVLLRNPSSRPWYTGARS